MTAGQIAEIIVQADIRRGGAHAGIRCSGAWTLGGIAPLEAQLEALQWPSARALSVDCSAITAMDTAGAWMLHRTLRTLEAGGCDARLDGLRSEFDALLALIRSRAASPDRVHANVIAPAPGALARLGQQAGMVLLKSVGMLSFLGEASVALLRSLARPSRIGYRTHPAVELGPATPKADYMDFIDSPITSRCASLPRLRRLAPLYWKCRKIFNEMR